MKGNKITLIFKRAPFPAALTLIFLLLFAGAYWAMTAAVEPYYGEGLLFLLPCVCFAIVTYFTVQEKMNLIFSSIITVILLFISGAAMPAAFFYVAIDAATTVTTNTAYYERALKATGYPDDPRTGYFPDRIPDHAEKVEFSYHPAFMQGGEDIALKFKTDSGTLENYAAEFSKKARWIGSPNSGKAEQYGIFSGTFNLLGYTKTGLPEDAAVYVLAARPYHPNDWNHGERSLAVISRQNSEILFFASDW